MENDIYNEQKPINKITDDKQNNVIEKIKNTKFSLFRNSINENLNENSNSKQSTARSIFSIKNSFHKEDFVNNLKIKLQQNEIKLLDTPNKVRKDNFGNEIKKGGKQKIVFADEIKVAESLKDINNKNPKNNKKKKNSMQLNDEFLSITGGNKRSYTPKNSRDLLIKSIYNIYKYSKKNKIFVDFLVNEIKIECNKKETKMNTFAVKKRNIFKTNSEEEEQVCCTCYCTIW